MLRIRIDQNSRKMVCKEMIMLSIFSMQNTKAFSDKCSEYFEGFYLHNGYNKNVAPHKNITVFQLQHVNNIVKVGSRFYKYSVYIFILMYIAIYINIDVDKLYILNTR